MIEVMPFKDIDPKLQEETIGIWDDVVAEGTAFPQTEILNNKSGSDFFNSQSYTGVAVDKDIFEAEGLYILHPNNIGRCGHICNASYAVKKEKRGIHIGELLVKDCMKKGRELGFKILQFNAVVASNQPALSLYKKLGFIRLGVIPQGFYSISGKYEDIIPHYISL